VEKTADSKIYYSIKEASVSLNESESTLRYWESEFKNVINPKRKKRDVRYYSEKDIEDLQLLKYLIRDCGLTFEGVRKKLKSNIEDVERQAKVVQHLKNIRAEVKALNEALNEVEKKKALQAKQ
jgi:Predicted transcriptional regulators